MYATGMRAAVCLFEDQPDKQLREAEGSRERVLAGNREYFSVENAFSDFQKRKPSFFSMLKLVQFFRNHPDAWGDNERGLKDGKQSIATERMRVSSEPKRVLKPTVTIITVVRNGAGTLERTVQSVLAQTGTSIEYLIIDGNSDDGTVEIIKKYEDRITYWVSEKDRGIYDAMNKGISLACGSWIYFLGSDDFFVADDIVSSLSLQQEEEAQIVFGNVVDDNGRIFESRFGWRTLLHNTVHHQSAFYRADLFRTFRYSTIIPVVSDYELNLRILLNHLKARHVDQVIAHCASSGISQTGSDYRNFLDYFLIRSRYIAFWKNFLFFGILLVSLAKKRVLTAFSRA